MRRSELAEAHNWLLRSSWGRTAQSDDDSEPCGDARPLGQLSQDALSLREYLPAAHHAQLARSAVSSLPAGHSMQLVEVWLDED